MENVESKSIGASKLPKSIKDRKWFRCFTGLHRYEIHNTYNITNGGDIIGHVIVSRCITCGKLTQERVTLKNY